MSVRPHRRRIALIAASAIAMATILAACSGTGSGGASGSSLVIEDPWIRVPMTPAGPAGAFMTIRNTGSEADALLAVSTPVAGAAEVHETTMAADGSMGMSPIDRLEIPAGGTVELKSGSYHVMLIGLTKELKAGDTVQLTLTFEKSGPVTVAAEVRAG